MAQSKLSTEQANSAENTPPVEDPENGVPERPCLAPGIELSGEMQESGFEQEQWLVQRDGQFIQLTPLLYRVLEQVDGQRTLDDIADRMSETTGRKVSAGNVRQLIDQKLIPLGLIVRADGSVDTPKGAGQSRSPLSINMRTTVVKPSVINPITSVLQWLYWPPVLVSVLVVSCLVQGWLFFVHGIAGATRQALYHPAMMLWMLGFIILATAFHEFGHASALQYGGGKVRGMGVGLYLVYPAFFTDVTDNYRLGRWARIRTDLGGFYFNLIFALVTLAVYALIKQEVLLLVVLYADMEIFRQVLPFVRLDGYWALADLTGLPDFFSQIMPFLRTILPLPWWKEGRTLPHLKGWVKLVFGLYILITVPLLAFLLLLTVKSAPRVVATSWDSFRKLGKSLSHAVGSGDVLTMITTVLQMALLALPTLGLAYMFYKLGHTLVRALWNWSKPTPARRTVGTLGGLAAIGLLAWLWMPSLPSFPGQSGTATAPLHLDFQPIGPYEQGTVVDLVHDVPVVGSVVSALAPPHRTGPLARAMSSVTRFARRTPVLGGVVNAAAPENGSSPIITTLRTVPVLGGIVNTVSPPTERTYRQGVSAPGTTIRTGHGSTHPLGSSGRHGGHGSSPGGQGGAPGGGILPGVSIDPIPAPVPAPVSGSTSPTGSNTNPVLGPVQPLPTIAFPSFQSTPGGIGTPVPVTTPGSVVTQVPSLLATPGAVLTQGANVVQTPAAVLTTGAGVVKTVVPVVTQGVNVVKTVVPVVTQGSNVVKTVVPVVTQGSNIVKTVVPVLTHVP